MTEIRQWLESLGIGEYADAFDENAIDTDLLVELTDDDLRTLGVDALGHRKRILKAASERDIERVTVAPGPRMATRESPPPAREAERRQLTVLFADLVGSTALSRRMDPEDLRDVMTEYQGACKQAVVRYDGYIARFIGDGLLAYFGYPAAHENDAERAVESALSLVALIDELNVGVGTRHHIVLSLRVGIATGLVVAGDLIGEGASQEHAVVGETPNLAARLQSLAEPNTIVVAPTVHRLTAGRFDFQDLGKHALKGFEQAVNAWRVLGQRATVTRFDAVHSQSLTPLVGREEELESLGRRWIDARAGEGQVVLISGEPGIGKSRLCNSFVGSVDDISFTRLGFQCSPHHANSALYPIITQLQHAAGLTWDLSRQEKLRRLDAWLGATDGDRGEDRGLLARLLSVGGLGEAATVSLDAGQQRQRVLAILLERIITMAADRPVICVFEDSHWIDPTSLELLSRLCERVATHSVLVLITFRPEFEPPWVGQPHVTLLAMRRLAQRHSLSMVEHLTRGTRLEAARHEGIIARTDGVPLFIEELTHALMDSADRAPTETATTHSLEIPETIRDSLMARLDRLDLGKPVAQIAAVVGRDFSREILELATDLDAGQLDAGLNELLGAGLITRRGADAGTVYSFKHALVRDAAYESILTRSRKRIHARIARAYESRWPEGATGAPELLGHHLELAGLGEQAIDYWLGAARQAMSLAALKEAVEHASSGLALLDSIADDQNRRRKELDLRLILGPAVMAIEGYGSSAIRDTYERAYALCEALQLTESPQVLGVLAGLRRVYSSGGALPRAQLVSERSLSLAERCNDDPMRLDAHYSLGRVNFDMGQVLSAQCHMRKASELSLDLALARKGTALHGIAHGPICNLSIADALWLRGYPEQATHQVDRALARARQGSPAHSYTLSHVLLQAAAGSALRGDVRRTLERSEECIAFVLEHGFRHWLGWATTYRGWALAMQGRGERGLELLREGLAEMAEIPTLQWCAFHHGLLTRALLRSGKAHAALDALEKALDIANQTGERFAHAELYRLEGEVVQAMGGEPAARVEACFERALDVALTQEARAWELRATVSLARFLTANDRRPAARERLAAAYGWFTEGFGTPDLVQAKALLDELS